MKVTTYVMFTQMSEKADVLKIGEKSVAYMIK